ncbi:hypothetical protein COMNV_00592 [Commensalibacter sp. Nvir]|uniref:DUF1073 domain-containing protein n=1 Tax=Commensalibacter sp. Nvir TaxID=3069817 RepID=UPI002D3712E1|nr:hypothetical protein COMNV_00592 [Commensalibacter sp. Nvir]
MAKKKENRKAVSENLYTKALSREGLPSSETLGKRDLFRAYEAPEGVKGKGAENATVNDSFVGSGRFGNFNLTSDPLTTLFEEGIGFPGYPYLSQLSLRNEYRLIVTTRAQEMTRAGITFEFVKKDKGVNNEKLDVLQAEFNRLDVLNLLRKHLETDAYFGLSHLYIDLETAQNDPEEKSAPLYLSSKKIKKGELKGFRLINPNWVTPVAYNAQDPLSDDFYKPSLWWVLGQQIHQSRLLTLVTQPVPDLLKPAYNFGGVPFAFSCKPYIDNWLRTRQSVSDLIKSFSAMVLKTDLTQLLSPGCEELTKRAELMAAYRDNRSLQVIDKESEDLINVCAPLGGLDRLQAQAQEHLASVSGIPLVKLLGITPSGLNASSDGEMRAFYDRISAMQESDLRPVLQTVLNVIQLSTFGEIDKNIRFSFNPLWQLDDLQQADVDLKIVQSIDIMTQSGALSTREAKEIYKNLGLSSMDGVALNDDVLEREGRETSLKEMSDYA